MPSLPTFVEKGDSSVPSSPKSSAKVGKGKKNSSLFAVNLHPTIKSAFKSSLTLRKNFKLTWQVQCFAILRTYFLSTTLLDTKRETTKHKQFKTADSSQYRLQISDAWTRRYLRQKCDTKAFPIRSSIYVHFFHFPASNESLSVCIELVCCGLHTKLCTANSISAGELWSV